MEELLIALFTLFGAGLLVWGFLYAVLHLQVSIATTMREEENYYAWLDFWESDGINPDAPWD